MSDPIDLPEGVERRSFDGATRLATRGGSVYGEPTDGEWRAWDPNRSKLAAMFELGIDPGLDGGPDERVLYLGAASGTTVSHVADFSGPTYAVEFAPRPARKLVDVADSRQRLFPILADARLPEQYGHVVESDVDVLLQDVATRGQAHVAIENRRFLAEEGRLVLAVKARSEDVTAPPGDIFDRVRDELEEYYDVRQTARLDAYHTDHLGIVATPK